MLDYDTLKRLHEAATPSPWAVIPREVLEDGSEYPMHVVGGARRLEIASIESLGATCKDLSDEMVEGVDCVHSRSANGEIAAYLRNAAPEILELIRDQERLEWLAKSDDVTPGEAADIVNGFRWQGKCRGSLRAAIDAAMESTKK